MDKASDDVNYDSQNGDLRILTITDFHKAGKGYKVISKSLNIYQSIGRQTVYK